MTTGTPGDRALGVAAPRIDGIDKTTGQAEYTPDVELEGILWGKVLHSPHAHARIAHIDTTAAKRLPGVHAVVTGNDTFPGARYGRFIVDIPVLAQGAVYFVGEQIAAVAADDEEIAQRAIELIEVEFEELPSIHDPEEAMKPDTAIVHPDMLEFQGLPKPLEEPANIYGTWEWAKGDVESGFAEADLIIENTFTTPRQHHAYMEPHSCVVKLNDEGRLEVWAGNKSPYPARRFIGVATGLEPEQILMHPVTIGGDFGGKGSPMQIPIAHLLAKATGRPIRMVLDYTEEFMAANPRHPSVVHMRTGVKRDGRLVAHDATVIYDSGAYGGYKPQGHLGGASAAGGPYKVPNGRVTEIQVYTNNVPCGYMRGPGEPQTMFAVESQMDCVAHAVDMDPAEFRKLNLIQEGDEQSVGGTWRNVRSIETLQAALDASGYDRPKPQLEPGQRYGRGVAIGERAQAGGITHAGVTLNPDGTAVAHTTVFEQGTGSYTVMQQMVADGFGIPLDRVSVSVWDTDSGFNDSGIGGARVTRMVGEAMSQAIDATKTELYSLTAELLGWPDDKLTVSGDRVTRTDTGESEDWAELISRTGDPVEGHGNTEDNSRNPVTHFTVQVAEVSVDEESGQVKLLRITTAHDTGVILNPVGHQGQINGGLVQGIGYGLSEELRIDDDRVSTLSFADYKVPTIADLPELNTVLLEPGEGFGAYGIKGI
ncbi:MAG: xanthine dehydrogenase family protein molybdopterin-binding subunit, partial [Dehalococcoidia bacterium]